MKTVVFFLMCFPLISFAQTGICKEIKITHTVEDWFTLPIVPIGCDIDQKHGPISITDSLEIAKIYDLLLNSEECQECNYGPDVRVKTEFVFENESFFLCFSNPKDIMSYKGKLYKYNPPLCTLILTIITKTGVKMPEFIDPPHRKL